MNLSKCKLRILLIVLSILTFLVFSLCSFSFRPAQYTVSYSSSPPSLETVQNVLSILSYQLDLTSLNRGSNFLLLYGVYVSGQFGICAVISSSTSVSVSVSGSTVYFTFSPGYLYQYNNSTGFFGGSTQNNLSVQDIYIYYSDVEVPATSNLPSFTGLNPSFYSGSGTFNSFDVLSYYRYIYESALYRDERESELRSDAFAEGQSEGYEVGLDQGYNQGYDSGYLDGESRGYDDGYHDGFDTGYDYGYQFGYEDGYDTGIQTGRDEGYLHGEVDGYERGYEEGYTDGYDDGLSDAEPGSGEVVTEIVYRDAVDLDVGKVISGVGSIPKSIIDTSFDINILGFNIAGVLGALIIVVVVAFVVRKLKT